MQQCVMLMAQTGLAASHALAACRKERLLALLWHKSPSEVAADILLFGHPAVIVRALCIRARCTHGCLLPSCMLWVQQYYESLQNSLQSTIAV